MSLLFTALWALSLKAFVQPVAAKTSDVLAWLMPSSFGISFFRARIGRYVRKISSPRICSRITIHSPFLEGVERDPVTARSPVITLRHLEASRSVSILRTWTYNPQKRQVGSA